MNKIDKNNPLVIKAIKKLDYLKKRLDTRKDTDCIRKIFPHKNADTYKNYVSKLRHGEVSRAEEIIGAIDAYLNENIRDVGFYDLNDFFVSKKVCERISPNDANRFIGDYLLFRPNIDAEIIVSYFNVSYNSNMLKFIAKRTKTKDSDNSIVINIETEGIIIDNQENSYLCIGVSKNTLDDAMCFSETITIYKNPRKSKLPNLCLCSGVIALSDRNVPFTCQGVLVKIYNDDNIQLIRDDLLKNDYTHNIIKVHAKEDLLSEDNDVNKIINIEGKHKDSFVYIMDGIINRLELKPENNMLLLSTFQN